MSYEILFADRIEIYWYDPWFVEFVNEKGNLGEDASAKEWLKPTFDRYSMI